MFDINVSGRWMIVVLALFVVGCYSASDESITSNIARPSVTNDAPTEFVVEASCGECQFGLPGEGCDLAVRIDGQAYYVDGTRLDELGDAHAEDGLCNVIRQAQVIGKVENDRFAATSFELMPHDSQQQRKKSRLGIALEMVGDDLFISDVFEDSPAEKAGLKPGDLLVRLNNTPVAGLEYDELLSIFTSNPRLHFSVQRENEPLEITVTVKEK